MEYTFENPLDGMANFEPYTCIFCKYFVSDRYAPTSEMEYIFVHPIDRFG